MSTSSGAKGSSTRASRLCRLLNRLGYGKRRLGAHAEPRLQSSRCLLAPVAGDAREPTTSESLPGLRHRVRPPVHDHQHADQALRRRSRALWKDISEYMALLVNHFNPATVDGRHVPLARERRLGRRVSTTATSIRCWKFIYRARLPRTILRSRDPRAISSGAAIATACHCFGCTAGSGSSCGGEIV